MSKNIIIIIGALIVIGLVVFLASTNKNGADEKNEQQNRERTEVSERVGAMELANGTYEVDTETSRIEWMGRAVGKTHNGQVNIKIGKINFIDSAPVSGSVVLDMTSISDDDLSGKMQETLVAHLKSNDFFAVADYPEAKLEMKSAQNISDDMYQVTADLTIKDQTNEVMFDAKVEEKNGIVIFSSSLDIDRTQWDINFGSETVGEKIGDQLIDDVISFDILFVGAKSENNVSE